MLLRWVLSSRVNVLPLEKPLDRDGLMLVISVLVAMSIVGITSGGSSMKMGPFLMCAVIQIEYNHRPFHVVRKIEDE